MKKILSILGYIWAVVCLVIVLIMFPGLDSFSGQLARLPFMTINPVYSGGDIDRLVEKDTYTLEIHKPVFEALIGESSEGFIQIKWIWKESVPEILSDSVDYNGDGISDFVITISTVSEESQLEPFNDNVLPIEVSVRAENGWIARIGLRNENN